VRIGFEKKLHASCQIFQNNETTVGEIDTSYLSLDDSTHSEIYIWFQELKSIRKDRLKKYNAFRINKSTFVDIYEQVVLTRCRIGHSRFTHIYLLSNEEQLNVFRVILIIH